MDEQNTLDFKIQLPFRLHLEQRTRTSSLHSFLVSVGEVVAALIIGGVIIWIAGSNPIRLYAYVFQTAFGSTQAFSDTMIKASPLIIVGLACLVAFRIKLWNIGAEGQFYLGVFGSSAVVLLPLLRPDTPRWIMIPSMLVAGFIAGAVWGGIPGYLKVKFRVNEAITSLMMNYIAILWNNYWLFAVWNDSGFQMSEVFPKTAWLPRFSDYSIQIPLLSDFHVHLGILLSIVMVVAVWFLLEHSRWGYELRVIGSSIDAAQYAGLGVVQNTILVMLISGGLAGIAGMIEVSGVIHRFQGQISPGYGFSGIIVAWLAKLNPLAVVPMALLLGALILASREIQPAGISMILQGTVLFLIACSELFIRYRVRFDWLGIKP